MKIYTEIQYKWLDDQLVKTSAKSFEYYGSLSLCVGSGGGGGVTDVIADTVDTATGAITDPAATVNAGLDSIAETQNDAINILQEGATDTTEFIEDGIAQQGDNLNLEGIEDGINEGVTNTQENLEGIVDDNNASLEDLESGINTTVADGMDGIRYNTEIAANAADVVRDRLMGLAEDTGEALGITSDSGGPGNVELDKLKVHKGRLKNKNKAKLAVNKSKGQGRKSLKIQRTA
jgi:hypothetical protein